MKNVKHISIFGRDALPDLVSYVYNWWSPIAYRVIGEITYRITCGFIENGKKTYLLYKDTTIVAVCNSVDECKAFVEKNHDKIASVKNDLCLYHLNKYNLN